MEKFFKFSIYFITIVLLLVTVFMFPASPVDAIEMMFTPEEMIEWKTVDVTNDGLYCFSTYINPDLTSNIMMYEVLGKSRRVITPCRIRCSCDVIRIREYRKNGPDRLFVRIGENAYKLERSLK